MNLIVSLYKSSIGKKWIVALTGLVLVGYVLGHLAGNLQVFAGPAQINAYAEFLHSQPMLLWVARIVLLICFFAHIFVTIQLVLENRRARPLGYAKTKRTRIAAKTMSWSGLVVLAFIIFHLLHLTVRSTDSRFKTVAEGGLLKGENDVYSMLILSFQHTGLSLFYIFCIALLCLHLSHGFSSLCQTLGLNTDRIRKPEIIGGQILAALIFLGYISIPVAVMTHLLTLK